MFFESKLLIVVPYVLSVQIFQITISGWLLIHETATIKPFKASQQIWYKAWQALRLTVHVYCMYAGSNRRTYNVYVICWSVCVCGCARDCYLLLLSRSKQATTSISATFDTIPWMADKCLVLSHTYILRLSVALL